MANACRGIFLAMRTQAASAERLARERDALLRDRDEAGFDLGWSAVPLQTLAQELDHEATSFSAVEPRPGSERPTNWTRYDD
jgi:hypothetical protein